MFPKSLEWPLERWVNEALDWLITGYGDQFEVVSDFILSILIWIEWALLTIPWWGVTILLCALGWHASRGWKLPVIVGSSLILVGSLGLWNLTMQTMALMIVAVLLSVVIGLPLGVLMSQSNRLQGVLTPVLDAMQTVPPFVYLVPAVMLFGLGKVPAIIATVIYAVPPLARLTNLGIRLIDREVMEASAAFGTGKLRQLMQVQFPLAMPNVMAGINQCTMMALGMVVIASMIGARGLGEQVLVGIQRLDVGKGVVGGIGIVALAIIFDRITQAYGKRQMRHISQRSET
ncbi:ABC transporter permease [Roseovarius sp. ZX-A-9]|uniref:ABC transporter permease n=1 Tax=Roseovarius sp. ZX-A-9 TaxID=3014783 RepID=UPI00232B72E9|nr:proline/glycine betaine ABC transporter permease [Roseovarius sp. ZX-A-9]